MNFQLRYAHGTMGISQPCRAGQENKAKSWSFMSTIRSLAVRIGPKAAKKSPKLVARWVRHNGQRTWQAQAWLKQQIQSDEWNTWRTTQTTCNPLSREITCRQIVHGQQESGIQIQVSAPGRRVIKCHIGCQGPVLSWSQTKCPILKGRVLWDRRIRDGDLARSVAWTNNRQGIRQV